LTKGAIEALVKALAVELAPRGIRVNAVAPGTTDTPMNKDFFAIPDMKNSIIASIPRGKVADPLEIAYPIVFLASDAASHIVGQTLIVDGGYVAR
jgi:NAD(P)-dependent dehydrogenase (short-subunit alcohol dehydrogenase family)